jgi:hypothetical protein
MSLPNITFVKGNGGLGRPLAGQDHFSGLIFYSGAFPSGFSSSNRIKKFLSVTDAEAAGIKADYSDETKSAGSYLVTTVGANGDTINIKVNEPGGVVVDLGTYTKSAGQTTATAVGAAIAAIINAGTSIHGYTATAATGTVTITARPGLGLFLNSGAPIVVTIVGTIAGTLTQFTGGAASRNAIYHYHIREFFREQSKGVLWVGIFAIPGGAYDFQEITTLQNFSTGTIRQVGIYKDSAAFSTADMTTIQNVLLTLEGLKKPLIAVYGADLSGTTDISTLTDLNTFNNYEVSPCIGQDGGALGNYLYQVTGKSITTLGAQLGAIAFAKVNESIAWVQKFNISNGIECETLAFANGKLFSDASITDNMLDLLDQYRYVFLRKFVGQTGSYFNGFNMACSVSSDYAYGEDNRTIQKAIRGVYSSLLPALSGPLQLNADGTLSNNTVAYLETLTTPNLDQMVRDSELSAYGVEIDTAQNVLTTGKIIISVELVQEGVARQIQVPIGYTTSLS